MVVSAVSKRAGVVPLRTPHKMLSRLTVVSTIMVLENRAVRWTVWSSGFDGETLKRIRWKRVEKDSDISSYMLTHVQ